MLASARVKTSIFVVVLDNDWGAMMTMMLNNNRSAIMLNHNAAMVAVVGPLRRCGDADTAVAYRAANATGESWRCG